MSDRLLKRFEQEVRRATRDPALADRSPVLEALGYALWLSVAGELGRVRPADVASLRAAGRRALLGIGGERAAIEGADDDADDRDAARQVYAAVEAVARAGLQALGGTPRAPASRIRLHPPHTTLARMFRGEVDGLTAGRYAAHALDCARCLQAIEALRFVGDRDAVEPLAIAAAAPDAIRPPSEGRSVATLQRPALEAVLFADRRLAVYAEGHDPIRLVADGLTTEAALGGYWLGRLDDDVERIDATVQMAGKTVRWRFDLVGDA